MRRFLPPLAAVLVLLLWGGRATLAAPLPPLPQAATSTMLQGCPGATISSPRPGTTLRGDVPVIGTADADRFQFYKVEFAPASNPQAWSAVSTTINRPVANSQLDVWNTQVVPDGVYSLKLTVVDDRAQEVCWFVVSNLQVGNRVQPATPTQAQPSPTVAVADTPTPNNTPTPNVTRTATPQATVTPPSLPTLPPLPGGTPAALALAQATAAPTNRPGATPTAASTPRGTGTPGPSATPAARSGLSSLIPDFSGIRRQFNAAFDPSRIRDAFFLGAIGTLAVFAFIGLVALLRKLL